MSETKTKQSTLTELWKKHFGKLVEQKPKQFYFEDMCKIGRENNRKKLEMGQVTNIETDLVKIPRTLLEYTAAPDIFKQITHDYLKNDYEERTKNILQEISYGDGQVFQMLSRGKTEKKSKEQIARDLLGKYVDKNQLETIALDNLVKTTGTTFKPKKKVTQ